MENKAVVITGSSSGMGKAMAERFGIEGANVVLTGRNEEKLSTTKKELELKAPKGSFIHIPIDVRRPEDIKKMVEATVDNFGTIDHLVNNAAGNFICPAEELSINGWNSVIDIVLNGTFYCSKEVGKYWIDQKSKVPF